MGVCGYKVGNLWMCKAWAIVECTGVVGRGMGWKL